MQVIERDINSIKPYGKNPRKNEKAIPYVAKSIQEFGFKNPIVIDINNVIIAGHTRWEAAKKLGLEKVPTIMADDLTPEQVKAFRLADNKVAEIAEWDFDLLGEELGGIVDIDMEDLGFDLSMFEEEPESKDDDFDVDENLSETPYSMPGDIYLLGNHRLMCGDSTNEDDIHKLMGDEYADLLVTDPPYNVAYEGKTKDKLTIENDKMDNDNFREFLVNAFKAADSVLKEGAAFYIWHADSEGYNFRGACFDVGWKVRECLIWVKNSMVLGRQDYQWKHEPCLYGWKEGAGHQWYSDRKQTTVLNFDRPTRSKEHPTMKPIPLFSYQIENSSKKKDIVLDSFGGSGTTIMACEQMGRFGRSMELDPRYVDVIVKRYIKMVGSNNNCYILRGGLKLPLSDIEDFNNLESEN